MPEVSVILTSFNHAKYLQESIESVLAQTFSDFELIIWDDASSDDSWNIIQRFANADPRIKAFRNDVPRRGVYGINKSIAEIARGEYIAIHHSDDVWEQNKLEKQLAFMRQHAEVGAVFSNAQAIGEDSLPLKDAGHFYSNVFSKENRNRHEWLRYFFTSGNALCHPSVMVRKRSFEECGTYRFGLAQLPDFEMWVRLCLKYEIHVLPDKLVRFRVRANEANSSGSRPEVRIRDRVEFMHVLKHYFRISDFEELVAIFPEAERYRRTEGCEPRFVMAMIALGDGTFPWAKVLALETLFDLIGEADARERIHRLYGFDYRDLVAISGKHDVFALELVGEMMDQIRLLTTGGAGASKVQPPQPAVHPSAQGGSVPSQLERDAYAQAAQLLEAGMIEEGKILLERLATAGSSCWEVYNDLAVQYFNAGDFASAVPCFEQGVALEGEAGTTARNLALMLLTAGEVEAALAVWGRILRSHPQDDEVLRLVREVLSNLNPISDEAWMHLVDDLRASAKQAGQAVSGEIESTTHKLIGRPIKAIKIFQIYYDQKTRAQIDPAFIPLDNTDNIRPDWVEYWPIRRILSSQTFDDDDYLGFLSPKFSLKTGLSGVQVMDIVRQGDDEVISFSPFFDQGAIHANPFAQGEANHPGLLEVMRQVLEMLGVDIDPETIICDQTTTIFSNYFVARYSFWKKWFGYIERIIAVCEGPDCELKNLLMQATKYGNSSEYAMKVFVLERMVTVVLEELGLRSRIGMDFSKAPTLLLGARENLVGLVICDALKGQYRRTGLPIYVETLLKVRGA